MKDLIQTLRNIFKIPELKSRILYTLLLLAVYRLGTFITLPGVDPVALQGSFGSSGAGGNLLDLFNTFLGGAFARGSILALGIMPYISASIVVQLLGAVLPAIQKLRLEGESGQRKLNQITRYLTVIITLVQAVSYMTYLTSQEAGLALTQQWYLYMVSVCILTAGTMFLVWLGERITDNGIGNGVSLLIMIGIISQFPSALLSEANMNLPMVFFIEILALMVVTGAVVALTQATRKIPVHYARQMVGNKLGQMGRGNAARQYIPLKVNAAGVMPIIFAQAIMFLPATLIQWSGSESLQGIAGQLSDITSVLYNVIFFLLIILFTYFYTAITVNPNEIADQLKRNGGFIPGVKPGKRTAEYIDTVLSRITLPGSVFLAFVSIFPAIAVSMGVSGPFSQFFGGTTLLIMIGVTLDTLQQVESYLLMRHYDGLMQTGRVKGRSRGVAY
ncbi:preprotein translocase subunit SecY [Pontibacter sp. G13]|uniref:preprotein translocase subunit SecY n=1 Tax=Pontibacter sp. G13 TaxID=3074898 RepID=UPI002889E6E1|nr:preprotein translocase subunit SecY [Pontibacter sp. G13]WNJ16537.1 preprotein translocase subunit SecY [Pontibacter sp. G13]